ncbi:hypothetical protein DFH28DRAFT_947304 [Melampsora americana]|nr:hypothetical protein DFH28DRAFT_947304 [Melampsora americana]
MNFFHLSLSITLFSILITSSKACYWFCSLHNVVPADGNHSGLPSDSNACPAGGFRQTYYPFCCDLRRQHEMSGRRVRGRFEVAGCRR